MSKIWILFGRLFRKIRYLNLANNINIDDHCLTKLHFIDDSLEYLDLSGTNVTLNGLGTGLNEQISARTANPGLEPRTALNKTNLKILMT